MPEQVRLVDREVDVGLADGPHPPDEGPFVVALDLRHGLRDPRVEDVGAPVGDLVEQRVLVGEVVVGRAGAHAHRLGHAAQGHLLRALRAHPLEGLGHEGLGEVAVVVRASAACGRQGGHVAKGTTEVWTMFR